MKKLIPGATPPPNPFNLRTNNVSGETIPASAIMLVSDASDADDDGSYDVTKPDGTDGAYWVNAPVSVPTDSPGAATNRFPCMVAYDSASTPAAGDEWGPVAGSWLLTDSGTGFRILGGPVDGLVRVEKIGGGGTSEGVDIKIVLIDQDITYDEDNSSVGILEADPASELTDEDVLTVEEIANGWTAVYQDPTPEDTDDYTTDTHDTLNLWAYKRKLLTLKYFTAAKLNGGIATGGTARVQATGGTLTIGGETITLAAKAGGAADGLEGNSASYAAIQYSQAENSASYDPDTDTLSIGTVVASGVATTSDIQAAINTGAAFVASGASGSTTLSATTGTITGLAGGQDTTITLADGASVIDGFYVDDTIELIGGTGSGQSGKVTAYDGVALIASVDAEWSPAAEAGTEYRITSAATDKALATTTVDDTATKRRIVRYATMDVFYDDGKAFLCGEYSRSDYPDYPENESFPPDGTGTYAVLPAGFLTKRYRGIAINGVLIVELCEELPPPTLPEA